MVCLLSLHLQGWWMCDYRLLTCIWSRIKSRWQRSPFFGSPKANTVLHRPSTATIRGLVINSNTNAQVKTCEGLGENIISLPQEQKHPSDSYSRYQACTVSALLLLSTADCLSTSRMEMQVPYPQRWTSWWHLTNSLSQKGFLYE